MTNQQISLAGLIQNSDLKIVLYTLASISGMTPRRILEHCICWAPTNPYKPTLGPGQVNQIEQYRITTKRRERDRSSQTEVPQKPLKGISNVDIDVDMTEDGDPGAEAQTDGDGQDSDALFDSSRWTLHMSEVPEAGKRKSTSRSTYTSQIIQGNVFDFLENLGYSFAYEYWVKGYEFVVNKVLVRIFRILVHPTQGDDQNPKSRKADDKLQLIDSSGQWTVTAEINVKHLTDVDAVAQATAQLEKFQQEISPLFELKMPDRTSWDTRVRST